jgi:DNA-binding NarL/FixJ family response regulator
MMPGDMMGLRNEVTVQAVPDMTVAVVSGVVPVDHHRRALAYVGPRDERVLQLLAALRESVYDAEVVDDVALWCRSRACTSAVVLIGRSDAPLEIIARVASVVSAECRIIVLAELDDGFEVMAAVQAGASGFCAPDAPIEAIMRTINDVVSYGAAIPRCHAGTLVAQLRHGRNRVFWESGSEVEITQREWDVLSRLCLRMSTAAISQDLYVSTATVRSHVKALVAKFGVHDRDALVELFRSKIQLAP